MAIPTFTTSTYINEYIISSAEKNFMFIPASGWLVCGAGMSRTEAGDTGDSSTASRDVC